MEFIYEYYLHLTVDVFFGYVFLFVLLELRFK